MEIFSLSLVVYLTVLKAQKELFSSIVRWVIIFEVSEFPRKREWLAQYLGKVLVLEFAWLSIPM